MGADLDSVFGFILALEQGTTASLSETLGAARAEADYLTEAWLLDGLMRKQIAEESQAQTIIDRLRSYPDAPARATDFDAWIAEEYA